MKLFINDKPIRLLKTNEAPAHFEDFDHVVSEFMPLTEELLEGRVLILDVKPVHLETLLAIMAARKLKKLESIICLTNQYKQIKDYIKSQFKVVKAAGGLVQQDNQFLMIYRLGKWDLPKGKIEKDEKSIEGAVREVEEECNVRAVAHEKICATWHTFMLEGKRILKKTTWYHMLCLDYSNMKPQTEENIEALKWMSRHECYYALQNSYTSIQEVFKCFEEKFSQQNKINESL